MHVVNQNKNQKKNFKKKKEKKKKDASSLETTEKAREQKSSRRSQEGNKRSIQNTRPVHRLDFKFQKECHSWGDSRHGMTGLSVGPSVRPMPYPIPVTRYTHGHHDGHPMHPPPPTLVLLLANTKRSQPPSCRHCLREADQKKSASERASKRFGFLFKSASHLLLL